MRENILKKSWDPKLLIKKSTPRSEVEVLIAEAIYGPKTYVVYL
jgi:hypothetical protein